LEVSDKTTHVSSFDIIENNIHAAMESQLRGLRDED
jgi:hypothetical protein